MVRSLYIRRVLFLDHSPHETAKVYEYCFSDVITNYRRTVTYTMIYLRRYIYYIYQASARSTRNALNCINCPILCKRRSSFRAPLRYSSSLSLIHSPTLLSYMSGVPFSLSLSLRSHDFHFSQLCRVLLFLARLVLSPYGLPPCGAASGKATERTVFIFIYVVGT